MLPTALAMAFEMAAYGTLTGVLYGALLKMRGKNHAPALYGALVAAMVGGRLVHGAFMAVYMGLSGGSYTWQAFITADFVNAWPGMVLHLLLVPPVVLALERARLSVHPGPGGKGLTFAPGIKTFPGLRKKLCLFPAKTCVGHMNASHDIPLQGRVSPSRPFLLPTPLHTSSPAAAY